MKNPHKAWTKMTVAELRAATREYDDPEYRPRPVLPPPALKARHDRALRDLKRGNGRRSRRLSVTVEGELFDRVEALARREKVTPSQLVARGLQMVLAAR